MKRILSSLFTVMSLLALTFGSLGTAPARAKPLGAPGDFAWAKSMGGTTSYAYGNAIAVDTSGNVYTTGHFYGTVDFDPGAGTFNLTAAAGDFVSKLDTNGNFIWAKRIGGLTGSDITVDANGNVYTTGYFEGTVDFDPGAGTTNLTSAGVQDIFVSKLDTNGNFVWAKGMGGTGVDMGISIDLDTSGNVYTTGGFNDTADFDPGAGTFNLTSAGDRDIFVSKLDTSSGNFVWAKRIGGTGDDLGDAIAVDSNGNVYTTGHFQGIADFDPGAGTFNLTSAGVQDIFVSKLDSSGDFAWAKSMGGTEDEYGYDIVVDSSENVYTTGVFIGTADFDPGAGTSNLTSAGITDIFVSKLNSSGNFVWAKGIGGAGSDFGLGIDLDASGNVHTTGYFSGTIDFDPGAGTSNLTSAGIDDIFISKLDSSGNFVWAKGMGGANYDAGYGIAVDTSGNVHTTGYFSDTADFDPGAGTSNLTSAGIDDIFVSKLEGDGSTVTFDGNGNTGGSMSPQTANGSTALTLNTFTRTGYTFAGWSTTPTGSVVYADGATYDFSATITLYAQWTVNQYTISFEENGGSAVADITDDFGAAVSAPSDPTRSGYTFGGWYSDAGLTTPYTFSTMPATNITLYAKWVDSATPTVTSIVRASTSPTSASSVDFTVTFSEAVQNVDVNDFSLTTTGVSSASITGVTPVSASVYTVSVNTGSGNGTIRLDVPNTATIKDLSNNDLSGLPFTSGESYTVVKSSSPTTLVNSVLPTSRTPMVGSPVTIFNTVLNAGAETAYGVSLSMNPAPAGSFSYTQTNCASNAVIGSPNAPVDIPAGGLACYVLSFTPSAAFSATQVHIQAQASNASATSLLPGINTWLLRSTASAGPDVIALTTTTDFHQVACSGLNAFAVALSNVGAAASGDITVSANTGSASLPISVSIQETNPGTGAIIGDHILNNLGAGENRTVAVFVTFNGCVNFDPAANRIFIEFRDASNNVVGSTSTAVSTNR